MRRSPHVLFALSAAAAIAARSEAWADCDPRGAGEIVLDADDALAKGDATRALDLVKCAETKVSAPTVLLLEARALDALGRLVEAKAAAERAATWPAAPDEPEPFKTARTDAGSLGRDLTGRIPRVVVDVTPPDAAGLVVRIDGQPSKVGASDVDPGKHEVRASANGKKEAVVTIDVPARRTVPVTLALEPAVGVASPPPNEAGRNYVPAGVLWGVAGAGVIVGVALSAAAYVGFEEVEDACPPPGPCAKALEPTIQPKYDDALGLANGAVAAFVVGGVVAGVAIGFTVAAPSKSAPPVALRVGPTFARVEGVF